MVRFLRCLVLAKITPKLHHKVAKRRFIVSIAVHRKLKELKLERYNAKKSDVTFMDDLSKMKCLKSFQFFSILFFQR